MYRSFSPSSGVKNLTPVFEPALDVVINEIHYHKASVLNFQKKQLLVQANISSLLPMLRNI